MLWLVCCVCRAGKGGTAQIALSSGPGQVGRAHASCQCSFECPCRLNEVHHLQACRPRAAESHHHGHLGRWSGQIDEHGVPNVEESEKRKWKNHLAAPMSCGDLRQRQCCHRLQRPISHGWPTLPTCEVGPTGSPDKVTHFTNHRYRLHHTKGQNRHPLFQRWEYPVGWMYGPVLSRDGADKGTCDE